MRVSSDRLIGMDIRVVAPAKESHQRRITVSTLEQEVGYYRAVLHIEYTAGRWTAKAGTVDGGSPGNIRAIMH